MLNELLQGRYIHGCEGSPSRESLPLSKEDRVFSHPYSGSILSDEVTAHCLSFDDEDLWDDIVAVLSELGCDAPKPVIADQLQGVETVGQLVTALAMLTSQPAIR
jgi:hypothetical protein